jgi:hypothetical protein
MDKNQIITLVVTAVVTMVTTAVTVRLSMNEGKLGIANKVKARLTEKFIIKMISMFSVLGVIYLTFTIYQIVAHSGGQLATRGDVVFIIILFFGEVFSAYNILTGIRRLSELKELERVRAEIDLPK